MLAFIVLSVFFNLKSILMNINKYNTLKTLQANGEESYIFKKEDIDQDFGKSSIQESIIVRKSEHHYDGFFEANEPFEICNAIEKLDVLAYKSTYQNMGVLLLQFLFSERNYFTIKLTHPNSEIKTLYIYVNRQSPKDFFLEIEQPVIYKSFEYWPSDVTKFAFSQPPFSDRIIPKKSLPLFSYAWSNERDYNTPLRNAKADQLILKLDVTGLCALASLWIDMGRDKNKIDEVCLEHPHLGFGGIAPTSLEVCFWLPGSIAFYNDDLDELYFPERE